MEPSNWLSEPHKATNEGLIWLSEKLSVINKRAKKLGLEPVLFNVINEELLQVTDSEPPQYKKVYTYQLTSATPKLNGWSFIAVMQPVVSESGVFEGNMVRRVPGFTLEIPSEFRGRANYCDHCHMQRRRNETFIVYNEDKQLWKQVGRNCLKDFLGTDVSLSAFLALIGNLIAAEDFCTSAGTLDADNESAGEKYHLVTDILEITAAVIRVHGWLPKSKATLEVISTAHRVENIASGASRIELTDEDKKLAEETADWLVSLKAENQTSDYLYNLSLLGGINSIIWNQLGITVSAVAAYQREQRRKGELNSFTNSTYLGEVGKRSSWLLKLFSTCHIAGAYGDYHLLKFVDKDNNLLIAFSSESLADYLDKFQQYKATVKEHSLYQGIKQTRLARVAVPKEKKNKEGGK